VATNLAKQRSRRTARPKHAPSSRPSARELDERSSRHEAVAGFLKRIASGPKLFLTAAVAVGAGIAVPAAISYFQNRIGPDIRIVILDDQGGVPDFSEAAIGSVPNSSATSGPTADMTKVGEQGIKIAIYGNRSTSVVIVGMKAHIFKVAPPISGTLFSYGSQGQANVQLGFDLSSNNPMARALEGGRRLGDPYFIHQSEPLADGKPTIFQIEAFPGQYTYYWGIDIQLLVNGRSETKTVGSRSNPFKVSGYARRYAEVYSYNAEKHRWVSVNAIRFCKSSSSPCRNPGAI